MQETKFKNLLVTGGAGFIGSNFVRWVLDNTQGASVTVLDAFTYAANEANLSGLDRTRLRVVKGDIRDASLTEELCKVSDAVVHFAAETHNDRAIWRPEPFITTNIEGTYTLLEAVRKTGARFHHISTDEVYGDLNFNSSDVFTEDSPYRPSGPYAASKAAADMLVRAWYRTYGIKATITNCSNNFGPFQHVEKFIPRQITNILTGLRPRLYGTGRNIRDWICVEDHCRAVWTVLNHGAPGETYLVGSSCALCNLEVLRRILRAMGLPEDAFDWVPERPSHDRRYAVSAQKLMRELGWRPICRDFDSSLKQTILWYAAHRSWWEDQKKKTEAMYRDLGL